MSCGNNRLATLDVSANTALKFLWCYDNQLTSLDLSKNINLEMLYCNSNQLVSLNVSNNTRLTGLYCYSNQLESLNVSKNTRLTSLVCYSNRLTRLDLSKNTALTGLCCWNSTLSSVNSVKLPQTAISNGLIVNMVGNGTTWTYKNASGTVLQSNVAANTDYTVTTIPFTAVSKSGQVISFVYNDISQLAAPSLSVNATGANSISVTVGSVANASAYRVEYSTNSEFTNSNSKILYSAGTTSIDNLNPFTIYYFRVMALGSGSYTNSDYSETECVRTLAAYAESDVACLRAFLEQSYNGVKNGTKISSNYDVNDPSTWAGVTWSENEIITFEEVNGGLRTIVTGTRTVSMIEWNLKSLKGSLDLSGCASLSYLSCYENQLTSLNVSQNTILSRLVCYGNQLTSLDVSKNTTMTYLDCGANNLTRLDLSNNTKLEQLYCWNSNLPLIKLSSSAVNKLNVNMFDSYESWTYKDASGNVLASNINYAYNYLVTTVPFTAISASGQEIRFVLQEIIQLGTPTLSVRATGSNSIQVTVGSVANASGYKVEYTTDSNFSNSKSKTLSSAGSSTIDNLNPNTTYYFRVMALGSGDYTNSGYSGPQSARTSSAKLATPGLASVTATGSSSVLVKINSVPYASKYLLEYSTNSNFVNSQTLEFSEGGLHSINNLNPTDVTYYFRVKAIGYGNYSDSDYSGVKSVFVTSAFIANDMNSLRDFLEKTDSNGLKNGKKINSNYNEEDIATWGVTWENNDGTLRVTIINWCNKQLVGALDLSGCTSLKSLNCYGNQLTSLNVSGCTALTTFYCYNNQLTSLNASGCNKMTWLRCENNPLTSLNVSGCTSLSELQCDSNQLTTLDVRSCTALENLNCWGSRLETVAFNKNAQSLTFNFDNKWTFKDVRGKSLGVDYSYEYKASNNVSLPFTAAYNGQTISFVNTVIEPLAVPTLGVQVTGSNSVSVTVGSVANASGYTVEYSTDPNFTNPGSKTLSAAGSSSINGLSASTTYYFRVKALGSGSYANSDCSDAISATTKLGVPTLSVSAKGSNSVSVTVGSVANALGYSLEFSTDPNFSNSQITMDLLAETTTISGLNANTTYYFRVRALGDENYGNSNYSTTKSVKTDYAYAESDINCLQSFLQRTDSNRVKNGTKINENYNENDATTWGVTWSVIGGVKRATTITWSDRSLEGSLDLSGCSALEVLVCDSNQLTSLDVSGCISLSHLYCYSNELTSLGLSGCTSLINLSCYSNQLTSLNMSGCTALTDLSCYSNQLTSLNLSGCTKLNELHCSFNELTSLDVSDCTALTYLYCHSNELESLDISNNTELINLACWNRNLTTVTLSQNARNRLNINMYGSEASWTYQNRETDLESDVAHHAYYKVTTVPFTGVSSTGQVVSFTDNSIDKVGDSFSTAKDIVFTNNTFTFTDKLGEGGYALKDVDIYKLVVTSADIGKSYTFTTSQPSGGRSVDTYIRLFDSAGNVLSYNDDWSGHYSSLTWVPATEGTYFFGVSTYSNWNYDPQTPGSALANGTQGDYTLKVTQNKGAEISVEGKKVKVTWSSGNYSADTVRYRVAGTTKWTTKNLKAGVREFTFNGSAGTNYEIQVLLNQQGTNVLSATAVVLDQAKLKADKKEIKDDTFQVNVTNYTTKNLAAKATRAILTVNGVQTVVDIANRQGANALNNGGNVAFKDGLFTFTGMNSNTQYKIQVSFSDGLSVSIASSNLSVKTLKAPYLAPVLVSATAASSTSITVVWEKVYGKNSNTMAQYYTVQYSTDGIHWKNATTKATGTSFTIMKLKPNTSYLVTVVATKDQMFNASAPSNDRLVTL